MKKKLLFLSFAFLFCLFTLTGCSLSFDLGGGKTITNTEPLTIEAGATATEIAEEYLDAVVTVMVEDRSGNSISFEREKNDKGVIHYYQIDSLKNFSQYKNVISGLIIDFRKTENTYFVNIKDWDKLIGDINKKSFNESDLVKLENLIHINKKKLKVNYRYDIDNFIKNAISKVNRRIDSEF